MSDHSAGTPCHCGASEPCPPPRLDLEALREKLAAEGGQKYWRSLEAAAETPEFQHWLHREFPAGASEWTDATSRRQFLKIMAASIGLAGLAACTRQPQEQILPYVKQPEELIPGIPLQYATAMTLGGYATGLLVESHEGRPTKVEGNPDHPMSLGAANVFHQASVLELYDPDRTRTVLRAGETSSWEEFLADLVPALAEQAAKGGAGLRLLTETMTSPVLAGQIQALLKKYPQAKWHRYEPWNRDNERVSIRQDFESGLDPQYHFEKARVIVALDSDFLFSHPANLRYARAFARARRGVTQGGVIDPLETAEPGDVRKNVDASRRPSAEKVESDRLVDPAHAEMNRLYVAEPTPTITGTMADSRLSVSASEMYALARAILLDLRPGSSLSEPEAGNELSSDSRNWLKQVMRDLRGSRAASIVIAGEGQPAPVHAMVTEINKRLHAPGHTIDYLLTVESWPGNDGDPNRGLAAARAIRNENAEPFAAAARQTPSLHELSADMHAGKVELLVMLGGNPVYNAPADFDFAGAMGKVRRCVQLGLFYDETARLCQWHLPQAHFLESWGDACSYDGIVSVIQPLIMPLYDSRTAYELLDALVYEQTTRSAYDIVRGTWIEHYGGGGVQSTAAEKAWRRVVHNGLDTENVGNPGFADMIYDDDASTTEYPPLPSGHDLEIVFKPDPTVWDGRFSNNGWLQELPKPISKLTWDNAALVSPKLALHYGLQNNDVVELTFKGRSVHAPVWIMPGQAENSVTLHLGYGRTAAGRVGNGQGVNAYALRTSDAMGFGSGLTLKKVEGKTWRLAATQEHFTLAGRDVYRTGKLEEFRRDPSFAPQESEEPAKDETLYPPDHTYPGYAWGMAIDLNTCIGCNACVVACQSENNIPIVGKGEILHGREMHWIRVDGYFKGDMDNPEMYHQPVPCMHCENAPCEVVCPVAATVHSPEGLNEQVYNRCIGTRYCSNNCPYKVRRFNFFQWPDNTTLTFKMQRNPDVSVRSRGIMEKCTFCVQRINEAKITAEKEDRKVRDGEIKTACQQTCPTEAIVFGDINDPNSRVSRLKKSPRNYGMLAELNTRPRTTYLARITNPHPEKAS